MQAYLIAVVSNSEVPEHGEYNLESRKWYCSAWLSQKEWEDIHDYLLAEDFDSSDDVIKNHTTDD